MTEPVNPFELSPSATPTSLPSVTRWRPNKGEIRPYVKEAAVRRIETLGNDENHRVQVIYAQDGGLVEPNGPACVQVVTRNFTRHADYIEEGGHTFDVRLRLRDGQWRVTAIHPSRPGPPTRRPSAATRHVLNSTRIALPPAAHGDVASGKVHDSVLEAMLAVSRRWPIGVSIVMSGNPRYVFGTDMLSLHPQGLAFDTWWIADGAVVTPTTPRKLIRDYMEALVAAGSYNVGGPVFADAPQFYTDEEHHDHVHAGFRI